MICLKKSKGKKRGSIDISISLSPAIGVETRENHHNSNYFYDSNTLSPHYLTNNYIRNLHSPNTSKTTGDNRITIPDFNEIRSKSLGPETRNPKKTAKKSKENVKRSYYRSKYCLIF